MFRTYFGIEENPFSNTPDPRYLFMSKRHQEALAHLMYGVHGGSGFVLLTGEVGTGKTTVSRCLTEQLPQNVDLALCVNPRLSESELLATICDEMGIAYLGPLDSLKSLTDIINRHLIDIHARGRRAVLIVDEAQNLSPGVLEQIRLLTNLETASTKLLQIILIGQPELNELLDRQEMRQLTQRITARYHLDPLTGDEAKGYILHRLRVGGLHADVFKPTAIAEICARSNGVPRLINSICERCLLGAYAQGKKRVDKALARSAAVEVLGKGWDARHRRSAFFRLAAGGALAAAAVAAFLVADPLEQGLIGKISRSEALAGLQETLRSWPSKAEILEMAGLSGPSPASDEAPSGPPAEAPAAPAEPAQSAETPPPSEALSIARLFELPDVDAGLGTALSSMFALWDPEYASMGGLRTCVGAKFIGLKCFQWNGDWSNVSSINRPTLISLVDDSGKRMYAVLTALDGTTATLDIGGRRIVAETGEISPYWSGDYLVLWKPSPVYRRNLQPGMRGDDVLWLRNRLAEIRGDRPDAADSEDFDGELKDHVIDFQRSRALADTGIVDTLTQIHLNTNDPSVPLLKSQP